jgi:HD-GYP domain-containing protein (c-di-GMP phosphodiesterase class II)
MLVVPMIDRRDRVTGCLQLINRKPTRDLRLASREHADAAVLAFPAESVEIVKSIASQSAVAIDKARLIEDLEHTFEGLVYASVVAIESRDPTTSGHSERVARLSVELARAVTDTASGAWAGVRYGERQLKELRYASLLHDFGKVGVREHVLVKAKKLHPDGLERIQRRAEIIRRGIELRATRRKLQYLVEKGARHYEAQATMLETELAASLAELDEALARIEAVNEPSVLPHVTGVETSVAVEEIRRLAERLFEDHLGNRQAVITADEAEALAVSRGSLTPDEYRQIRAHVVHTWEFLVQIPWTREFRRIPEIARSHHEKLDGSGYPQGLTAAEIPVQSRMMTIADIYDALTAFDRPYKAAVPPETALDILDRERRAGRIDTALLDLFVDARVWELTRRDRR